MTISIRRLADFRGRIADFARALLWRARFAWRGVHFNLVASVLPSPSPCKGFKRKAALACYKLRFNEQTHFCDHYELYRIVNRKKSEFYVFPMATLQGKSKKHLSYHRSGAFHWRIDGEPKILPQDGEADYRNADLISQAVDHLSGDLDGYCLAVGPGATLESLRTMLKILDGYVLYPLEKLPAELLLRRQNLTLPLPFISPQKSAVQAILADAKANNKFKVMTADEIESVLRRELGSKVEITRLNPKREQYVTLGDEYIKQIVEIAHSIAAVKIGPKAPKFWTDRGHGTQAQ